MENKTILLVEDNPEDTFLARRALAKSGIPHTLVVAADGVEALDYLFHQGDAGRLPELVLLDLKLPRIDGQEVLKNIRSNRKTCLLPVVVLSSSLEEKDLVTCYRLGANSYIQKTVDFSQFIDAVQALGHYWLVLNRPAPCQTEEI
jgi:two-component system, response regulator